MFGRSIAALSEEMRASSCWKYNVGSKVFLVAVCQEG